MKAIRRKLEFSLGRMFVSLLLICCECRAELEIGEKAPEVTLLLDTGKPLRLQEVYTKHEYVVVYFYPKAGCDLLCARQAGSLRDSYENLRRADAFVLGISHDAVATQRAFREKLDLPFNLASDFARKASSAFKVPTLKGSDSCSRYTYLIRRGRVVWVDTRPRLQHQADDVLQAIARVNSP